MQVPSPRFSQFLHPAHQTETSQLLPDNPAYESPPGRIHETCTSLVPLSLDEEIEPGTSTVPSINVAGNVLLAHTNVLEKIPHSFITEAEAGTNTELLMAVVEDPPGPSFQFFTTTDTNAQCSGCPNDTLFEQELVNYLLSATNVKGPVTCSKAASHENVLS